MPDQDIYPFLDCRSFDDMRRLSVFVRGVSYDKAVPFAVSASAMGLARHGNRGWRRAFAALVSVLVGALVWVLRRRQLTPQHATMLVWASFYSHLPDEAVRFVSTLAATITDTGRRPFPGAAGPLGDDAVKVTLAVLEMIAQHPEMFDQLEDHVRAARDAHPFGWVRK